MKTLVLATTVMFAAASPALAGGKGGERCSIRHFAGEWLTAFSYDDLGEEHSLACRFTLDRKGVIVRSSCLRDAVGDERVSIAGQFQTRANCTVSAEILDGATSIGMSGEISHRRDLLVGLVYGPEGTFQPFTAIRTAAARNGRPPQPKPPVEPPEEEIELSCSAEADDLRKLEVRYEEIREGDTVERYQFRAEYESQAGDPAVDPALPVELRVNGAAVEAKAFDTNEETGEMEAEFGYNSRKGGFPASMPDVIDQTTEASIWQGDARILSCTLQ